METPGYLRFFIIRIDVFRLIIVIGALLTFSSGATITISGKAIVVTDAANRTVTIDKPLDRIIVVNTSAANIIRALDPVLQKKIVGISTYIAQNPRFWPELKDKPAFKFTNLNYEELAEVNPQLLILYENSAKYTQEAKLESLGIKWLYLDCFNPETLDKDIEFLGILFERREKAQELIHWYQHYDQLIQCRLPERAKVQPFRVFYFRFADVYSSRGTYNTINRNSSGHYLVERSGGNNIAAGLPGHNPQVSPEWLVDNNPQVVIGDVLARDFSGYNANSTGAVASMKKLRDSMKSDKALRTTDAVVNDRVLLLSHDIDQGPSYVIGMACIAKFLYPDRFRDIVPDSIACDYLKTWCGLPCRGVFVYPPFERSGENAVRPTDTGGPKLLEIIDGAGRKVSIPQPLERIAGLQTSACNAFSLLQLEDKVVGVTEYVWNDPEGYPRLRKKTNVGSVYTPNYELIAQFRPQVVFMGTAPVNLYPAVKKLTPMGIAVAAIDFQPIKGQDAYSREAYYDEELMLLGRMTGREERACAFVKWKAAILEMIRTRTRTAGKKRVLGIGSVDNVLKGNSFTVWAGKRIIELAGGIDLGDSTDTKVMSGEWVLEQNPEAIIIASYWLKEGFGYGLDDTATAAETRVKMLRNKVVAQTRAAKEGKVFLYGYYGCASGGQTALGALYLAKRLYPDRFSDVDPEKYHREYFEKWLEIAYKGIWFHP